MSVFVQEVLGLLKRNFVKTSLNPTDDYFQFVRKGALSRARTSAGGFAPLTAWRLALSRRASSSGDIGFFRLPAISLRQ